ncbi:MAG: folate-binding protein [Caulobacteraceae bacterium]
MTNAPVFARLANRAAIGLSGPDWRGFLQGLISQDVDDLRQGEMRFGALLTPQGRVAFDLFVIATGAGALIDCAADRRAALIERLGVYRLRAKVAVAPLETPIHALWNTAGAPSGWIADPRLAALGFRSAGLGPPDGAQIADESAFDAHRLARGVPGSADWGDGGAYAIEADFDLLNGIDFKKGCFVGQETTSRMKRRGAVKSRMVPIAFAGSPPAPGEELLNGDLRAGQVRSAGNSAAIALLRLDRLENGPLTFADGRSWRPVWPVWLKAAIT